MLLTAAQVAKLLGVPTTWVYEQSRRGRIPTVTLGRYRPIGRRRCDGWVRLHKGWSGAVSAEVNLDPETIEELARRVAELLRDRGLDGELIDAGEVARRFGVTRDYVYAHAGRLGAIRLSSRPRARLRFDPKRVAEAMGVRETGSGGGGEPITAGASAATPAQASGIDPARAWETTVTWAGGRGAPIDGERSFGPPERSCRIGASMGRKPTGSVVPPRASSGAGRFDSRRTVTGGT